MSEYKFNPGDRVEVTELVCSDRGNGLRIGMVGEVVSWRDTPDFYLVAFDGFEPLTDHHVYEDGYLMEGSQMRLAGPNDETTDSLTTAAAKLAKAKVARAEAWAAKLDAEKAHEKAVAREQDAQRALERAVTQAARAR